MANIPGIIHFSKLQKDSHIVLLFGECHNYSAPHYAICDYLLSLDKDNEPIDLILEYGDADYKSHIKPIILSRPIMAIVETKFNNLNTVCIENRINFRIRPLQSLVRYVFKQKEFIPKYSLHAIRCLLRAVIIGIFDGSIATVLCDILGINKLDSIMSNTTAEILRDSVFSNVKLVCADSNEVLKEIIDYYIYIDDLDIQLYNCIRSRRLYKFSLPIFCPIFDISFINAINVRNMNIFYGGSYHSRLYQYILTNHLRYEEKK